MTRPPQSPRLRLVVIALAVLLFVGCAVVLSLGMGAVRTS